MNDTPANGNPGALPFTGERYLPEVGGLIELEHLHRYILASKLTANKVVLDIACGEGYGSALLAKNAKNVTGVDIAPEAVSHATAAYPAENLSFSVGSCAQIPLEDASVDVVVSFETIEHHDEHEAMMREIKRVLRPDGVLIISSPDKLEYSDKPGYQNEFHVKELYREEFTDLLGVHFKNQHIYGQRVVSGSAIFSESAAAVAEFYSIGDAQYQPVTGVPHALYLIAVASDTSLPALGCGILEAISMEDLIKEWAGKAVEREAEVKAIEQVVAAKDQEITLKDASLAEKDRAIGEKDALVAELTSKSSGLTEELVAAHASLASVKNQLAEAEHSYSSVVNSRSWRMTSGLRRLADLLRGPRSH
ncbi:hypothetical protein CR159_20230 [Pollutimonas subterranea]|uniref:Methyltransferase type 11 domain-containing protein n=1 Tax=Pollutimonas subterranea TaxID=2045210 RepID=A0A2N4TZ62_9BURK|nr:methyltransferase domain-containing protein [Pollutimonas subterranea]PLC48056.1 hypothetical protein CR159_20230 [Pollutimonas subterranea]